MTKKRLNTVIAAEMGNRMARLLPLSRFAIEWANDPDVEGKDVKKWIDGFEDWQWNQADWGGEFIVWEPRTFPKDGQRKVHSWLSGIMSDPPSNPVMRDLNKQAAGINGTFSFEWVDRFNRPLETTRMEGSPLALAALGTMAIASSDLREGFGQCEYSGCQRFFLETGVRRGPRGRRFCPTRSCGIAARVQRFNERKA